MVNQWHAEAKELVRQAVENRLVLAEKWPDIFVDTLCPAAGDATCEQLLFTASGGYHRLRPNSTSPDRPKPTCNTAIWSTSIDVSQPRAGAG